MIRYITRWALSTGIRKVEGKYTDDKKYFHGDRIFVSARETFATLDEAKDEAKAMAKKKVVSLRRQADVFDDPNWEPKVHG